MRRSMLSYSAVSAVFVFLTIMVLALIGAGCQKIEFRPLEAVLQEESALQQTIPFADAYVEKYPAEAESVSIFYDAWQLRIDAEKSRYSDTEK